MKLLYYALTLAGTLTILCGCSESPGKMNHAKESESTVEQNAIADTTKIKSDVNDIINSITSGNPDTNKLKAAASDILSKDASILSDSGIDKLTGKDPSAEEAGTMLKKMRDATGLTPGALDSIKKAAASLGQ